MSSQLFLSVNIRNAFLFPVCGALALAAAQRPATAQTGAATQKPAYHVEEIPVPKGVAPEIGGLGFTPSGKLVVLTRRSGILTALPTADATQMQWTRFSDQSLHNANGLFVISDREMLVSQMPELTRVLDNDGDGIADEYRTEASFNLSGAYHEVTAGPVPDGKDGFFIALNTASHSGFTFEHTRGVFSEVSRRGRNFASVQYRGWVMHWNPKTGLTPWAKGFRSPNGIQTGPDGAVWVTDNQGDFRTTNPLYHVEEGLFYGHPSSLVWDPEYVKADPKRDPLKQPMAELDGMRAPAAVLFPYGFSRSPAEPLFDTTNGKFGPFKGQMLVADAAAPRIIRVLLEKVDGVMQGACVDFYSHNGLRNGSNRMVFSPDGTELYVGQTMREWAGAMEGLQRIKFNGGSVFEILAMHLTRDGFELEFTQPVDSGVGEKPEAFATESYWYEYSSNYGGPEANSEKVRVSSVKWSADRRKVQLVYPKMQAQKVMRLNLTGFTSGAQPLGHAMVAYTINRLVK
jgi:glucose/arabinose dehydrogenase